MTEGRERSIGSWLAEILEHPDRTSRLLANAGGQAGELQGRIQELRRLGLFNSSGMLGPGALGELIVEPHLSPGDTVLNGRFRIEESLGRGGMGTVYRAHDMALERPVAIKVARSGPMWQPATELRDVRRFVRESRVHARLEHPNVAPVHELGVSRTGQLFLVMRLVDGRTLEEFDAGARKPSPLRDRLRWIVDASRALSAAHEVGIIHRDLKPSNLMIGPRGEVQVIDWGLAKLLSAEDEGEPSSRGADDDASSTATGSVMGTPAFMAPEQARGQVERIDERTDVFGLGAVLSFALTGQALHEGVEYSECLRLARSGDLSATRRAWSQSSLPREVTEILELSLATSPGDRYGTVEAMRMDIEAFLDLRPGRAWRDTLPRRLTKFVRRHPAIALAAAACLVVGALGVRSVVLAKEVRHGRDLHAIIALSQRLRAALAASPPTLFIQRDEVPGQSSAEDLDAPRQQEDGVRLTENEWAAAESALEGLVLAFNDGPTAGSPAGFSLVDNNGRRHLIEAMDVAGRVVQEDAQVLVRTCIEVKSLLRLLGERQSDAANDLASATDELLRFAQGRFDLRSEPGRLEASSTGYSIGMGSALGMVLEDFSRTGSSVEMDSSPGGEVPWVEVATRSGSAVGVVVHPDWRLSLERVSADTTVEIRAVCQRREGGFGQGQGFRPVLVAMGKCYGFPTRTVTGAQAAGRFVVSTGPVRLADLRAFDPASVPNCMGREGIDAKLGEGRLLAVQELGASHAFGVMITNHISGSVRYRYEDMQVQFEGLDDGK